jgi:hypothetical protein
MTRDKLRATPLEKSVRDAILFRTGKSKGDTGRRAAERQKPTAGALYLSENHAI